MNTYIKWASIFLFLLFCSGYWNCGDLLDVDEEFTSTEEYHPLYLVDINGENKVQLIKDYVLNYPTCFVSNDEELLYFRSRIVYKFNIHDKVTDYQFSLPFVKSRNPVISPDRRYIVFTVASDSTDLFRIDIDGNNIQQLTFTPDVYEGNVSISRDGDNVVFSSWWNDKSNDQTLSLLDLETGELTVLISEYDNQPADNHAYFFNHPVVVHDNTEVIYIKANRDIYTPNDSLYIYNIETQQNELIDPYASKFGEIVTSTDENLFLYCRYQGERNLILFNADSETLTDLGEISNNASYTLSSDGKIILCWNRERKSDGILSKMTTDDLKWSKFTDGYRAVFSSDSKQIAFTGHIIK